MVKWFRSVIEKPSARVCALERPSDLGQRMLPQNVSWKTTPRSGDSVSHLSRATCVGPGWSSTLLRLLSSRVTTALSMMGCSLLRLVSFIVVLLSPNMVQTSQLQNLREVGNNGRKSQTGGAVWGAARLVHARL